VDISSYIMGFVFIGLGFLVKAAPGLIAGYNTLSKEEKKNVDIEGLSSYARNCLIGIGLTMLIALGVLDLLNQSGYSSYVFFPIILVGMILLIVGSQKFDHNK
jgi:hypothetical protein